MRDSDSTASPPGLWAYALPLLFVVVCDVSVHGNGLWCFSLTILIFGILPLVEAAVGPRRGSGDAERFKRRARAPGFTWLIRLIGALVIVELAGALFRVSDSAIEPHQLIGATLALGSLLGAVGITIAHELGHRRNRFDRILAHTLLHASWYPHFLVEHNQGHHLHVGTPRDPASARPGESLYRFLPRVFAGTLASAFEIGGRRLVAAGRSPWGLGNPVVRMGWIQAVAAGLVGVLCGPVELAVWVAAGLIGALHLELVDYIEHYGLTRRRLEGGAYEPVTPRHSWNSDHLVGRLFLFELPRHSDHHAQAARPYQALRTLDGAPQLPAGYPAMMLMALVPPLWRRVMDPRVEAWEDSRPPLAAV